MKNLTVNHLSEMKTYLESGHLTYEDMCRVNLLFEYITILESERDALKGERKKTHAVLREAIQNCETCKGEYDHNRRCARCHALLTILHLYLSQVLTS